MSPRSSSAGLHHPLAGDLAQGVDDALLLGVEIDVGLGASIEVALPRAASMPTTGFPDRGLGIGLAAYGLRLRRLACGLGSKLDGGLDALSPHRSNLGL